MAENENRDEQARNMAGSQPGDQSQKAPGRGGNDDFSTENRSGSQTSQKQNPNLDREDREREQPGSQQRDQGKQ